MERDLMEWMLQVVDEVDDVVGAMKHRWLGLRIELVAAFGAAFAMAPDDAS